jgi:hypothetical protein
MYEVGRVSPRHVQRTCLTGESLLGRPRVAYTLHLYNYLFRFYLTIKVNANSPGIKGLYSTL